MGVRLILGSLEFIAVSLAYEEFSKIENLKTIFNFLSGNKQAIRKESILKIMDDDFNIDKRWGHIAKIDPTYRIIDETIKISKSPDPKLAE